jgi:hypothetical protein
MLREKRGDDHSYPIVHEAGFPKLPHAGIDDRVSRHAMLPGLQTLLAQCARHRPRKGGELPPEGMLGHAGPVEQQLVAELTTLPRGGLKKESVRSGAA